METSIGKGKGNGSTPPPSGCRARSPIYHRYPSGDNDIKISRSLGGLQKGEWYLLLQKRSYPPQSSSFITLTMLIYYEKINYRKGKVSERLN